MMLNYSILLGFTLSLQLSFACKAAGTLTVENACELLKSAEKKLCTMDADYKQDLKNFLNQHVADLELAENSEKFFKKISIPEINKTIAHAQLLKQLVIMMCHEGPYGHMHFNLMQNIGFPDQNTHERFGDYSVHLKDLFKKDFADEDQYQFKLKKHWFKLTHIAFSALALGALILNRERFTDVCVPLRGKSIRACLMYLGGGMLCGAYLSIHPVYSIISDYARVHQLKNNLKKFRDDIESLGKKHFESLSKVNSIKPENIIFKSSSTNKNSEYQQAKNALHTFLNIMFLSAALSCLYTT